VVCCHPRLSLLHTSKKTQSYEIQLINAGLINLIFNFLIYFLVNFIKNRIFASHSEILTITKKREKTQAKAKKKCGWRINL
jgi:hypothetical protein